MLSILKKKNNLVNLGLKSYTFFLSFIQFLHVWIRIHKAPEYGSGSTTLDSCLSLLSCLGSPNETGGRYMVSPSPSLGGGGGGGGQTTGLKRSLEEVQSQAGGHSGHLSLIALANFVLMYWYQGRIQGGGAGGGRHTPTPPGWRHTHNKKRLPPPAQRSVAGSGEKFQSGSRSRP